MDMPECIADCSDVEVSIDCNVGCISLPFVPSVKELSSGNSFLRHWDGMFYVMRFDFCQITGCFDLYEIPSGRFRVQICGYTAAECDPEYGCEWSDNGVIFNSYPAGEKVCIQHEFSIPEASGSTFDFYFGQSPP